MKRPIFFLFLVILLFGLACGPLSTPASPSLEPTAPAQNTHVSPPTAPAKASPPPTKPRKATPAPKATQAPDVTAPPPEPASVELADVLAQGGSHFYYDASGEGTGPFYVTSEDGSLVAPIPVPDGAVIPSLKNGLSPDGQWLVYYTGELQGGDGGLTLSLLYIPDGSTTTVSALLSADYPDNFTKEADELTTSKPKEYDPSVDWASVFQQLCEQGIHSAAWSPDGKWLAFAGEMDGPSSDLYVYSLVTYKITRLSSGVDQMQWIDWSPDGAYILYASNNQWGEGVVDNLWAARPDDTGMHQLKARTFFAGWDGKHAAILHYGDNGPGNYHIFTENLADGTTADLWNDSFNAFAYDPDNQVVLVSSYFDYSTMKSGGTQTPPGLYLYFPQQKRMELVEAEQPAVIFRGGEENRFVTYGYKQPTAGVTKAGQLNPLSQKGSGFVSVAPDSGWMVAGVDGGGLELYDESDQNTATIETDETVQNWIAWRPDGQAFCYVVGAELYLVTLPEAVPVPLGEVTMNNVNAPPGVWR